MSFPIPSGFDPQAGLDAALFAAAGGSSTASSDPAVDALDELGSSYDDEISFLQQQLQPSTGTYDETGSLVDGSSSGSAAAQLEQTLSGLLGGDSSSSTLDALVTETAGAGTSADAQLFDDAMPALAYDDTGSLLDSGSSLLDLFG